MTRGWRRKASSLAVSCQLSAVSSQENRMAAESSVRQFRSSASRQSSIRNHLLQFPGVGLVHDYVFIEMPLQLGVLRRQDVAREGMAALELARSGLLEALSGAFVSFQFRHGRDLSFKFRVSSKSIPGSGSKRET